MTAFFIPGVGPDRLERAYETIRRRVQADTGAVPRPRRIFKLHSRRDGSDCETVVGKPDPVESERVIAILDSGEHYAILCDSQAVEGAATLVSKHVYAVTEFDG
ncbi:MAG TPA: hypothetical protein VHE14_09185 [Solirubrobacteraceae bacterium]|nr:hypothetical protein [Solirubrobacteraceae bacterium]